MYRYLEYFFHQRLYLIDIEITKSLIFMANLLLAVFTAMRSSGNLGKPSKIKNYEILYIVQREGGVSTAAKLFIEEKYGHVYRAGG